MSECPSDLVLQMAETPSTAIFSWLPGQMAKGCCLGYNVVSFVRQILAEHPYQL
jgi:hypothetical protein